MKALPADICRCVKGEPWEHRGESFIHFHSIPWPSISWLCVCVSKWTFSYDEKENKIPIKWFYYDSIYFFHKCWFPRASKNHQPCSWHPRILPEDETFVRSFPEKLMITRVHGTKRGGTHIYGDQTRWQTGPSGDLPPTRKKKKNCSHTHTRRDCGTASQLKQHLIWGDGNRRTQACNPVRVTPACLKWVPVAIGPWLRGIGKWICLQSHSQMNTWSKVTEWRLQQFIYEVY